MRKKKCSFFSLLFLLFLSFEIEGLNLIWHAFQIPTGYLQRFAFLVSFVMIYLAVRVFMIFDKQLIPALFKVTVANVFLVMLLTELAPEQMSIHKALFNILLLVAFSLCLYARTVMFPYRKLFTFLLLFLSVADVGSNAYNHIKTLNSYPGYSYPRNIYNSAPPEFEMLVREVAEEDQSFYRLNTKIRLTANDSLRYHYKGMTNFNSMGNGILHDFMYHLGYSTTMGARSLTQNDGVLASDALLGFKYVLTDQPVNKHGYVKTGCENGICLYE
ncbi:YfhO family protein [Bacillaceae bacterium Marseille-Q3522]|nr:YfhO family protein [Bacillaceae bacterium Marseille-Q3522]